MSNIKKYKLFTSVTDKEIKLGMDIVNESRWLDIAVMRGEYKRDEDIRDFFLSLNDLGGRIVGIRNLTHTIFDEEFELKDRISYVSKPIYYGYTLGLRFEELSLIMNRGNSDTKMEKTIEFFNEIYQSLSVIKGFGYKFNIYNFKFDILSHLVKFDIKIYHPDDIVAWEHIFAYKES
jgi:hypothetical protein